MEISEYNEYISLLIVSRETSKETLAHIVIPQILMFHVKQIYQ